MEQLTNLLEATRKSKAMNESVRDSFLNEHFEFFENNVRQDAQIMAARYNERALQDEQLIVILERLVGGTSLVG